MALAGNWNAMDHGRRPALVLGARIAEHFMGVSSVNASSQLMKSSLTDRPLGSFENFLWLIDQNRPTHFGVVAQVSGRTEVGHWQTALTAAQTRHPLLSVRIQPDPAGRTAYFVRDQNAGIPLRLVESGDAANWQRELACEMGRPFDWRNAPLARVVLLHQTNQTHLILMAHHAVADGLSLVYAARDILLAMAGERLAPLPAQSPYEELLADTPAVESPGKPAKSADGDASRAARYRPLDGAPPFIDSHTFDAETTEAIAKRSREERTTVHGALCAAFLLAGRKLLADWAGHSVRCMSPINLRQFCSGVADEVGVFIGRGISVHPPESEGSFWSVARSVKEQLRRFESFEFTARMASRWRKMADQRPDTHTAAAFYAQSMPHELLITNLGRLAVGSEFGSLRLEAFWGPALTMGFEGEQSVGASTVGGCLACLYVSYRPIEGLVPMAVSLLASESR